MPIIRTALTLLLATLLTMPATAADLRLETFFEGRTEAKGTFRAITGLKREFDVVLHGRWDGRILVLREEFRFADGERDTKTWRFVKTGPNTYAGTREDVLGETKVTLAGNEAHFSYRVDLDPGEGRNVVRFFDKLELSPDGRTLLNRASVFKGLLPVASVRVEFRR